jgi:hypothetical protein
LVCLSNCFQVKVVDAVLPVGQVLTPPSGKLRTYLNLRVPLTELLKGK